MRNSNLSHFSEESKILFQGISRFAFQVQLLTQVIISLQAALYQNGRR